MVAYVSIVGGLRGFLPLEFASFGLEQMGESGTLLNWRGMPSSCMDMQLNKLFPNTGSKLGGLKIEGKYRLDFSHRQCCQPYTLKSTGMLSNRCSLLHIMQLDRSRNHFSNNNTYSGVLCRDAVLKSLTWLHMLASYVLIQTRSCLELLISRHRSYVFVDFDHMSLDSNPNYVFNLIESLHAYDMIIW